MTLHGACDSKNLSELKIFSGKTDRRLASFQVELADDAGERSLGLMYRQELGPEAGMLFIFPQESLGPFWMRNTLIPLDIIFVDSEKKIISIVAQAEPQSETPREAAQPYRYVLEIAGGRAAELGLNPGDRLEF
jgi:uncharacterized membrane protein (UPF0127 family)